MIDEKKIEEAIKEASSKLYNLPSGSPTISNHFTDGFLEGIKWFLSGLWHPMSETPEMGREILIQRDISKLTMGIDANKTFVHEYDYHDDWVLHFGNDKRYLRWLYIDDLLKGGGGVECKK